MIDFGKLNPWEVMEERGKVPLPPYIKREPEASDSSRYQTVYAELPGAVAAPTAGSSTARVGSAATAPSASRSACRKPWSAGPRSA